MKKIGIDARLISQTGVGSYTLNLLSNLEKYIEPDTTIYVFMRTEDRDVYTPKSPNVKIVPTHFAWHSFKEQYGFLRHLNKYHLDLMHFTYFSYPVLYRRPFVITIHDLTPLHFATGRASTKNPVIYGGKYLAYRYLMNSAIHNARVIITPSETVKKDIIQTYGPHVENKISVTYEGIKESLTHVTPAKLKLPYDFFLYVGNFYPHKNVENLIHAFKEVHTDHHLVLIGPKDHFSSRIHELIGTLNLGERVHMLHTPSESELAAYYLQAKALIHPSKAEGLGLPLLEASFFGCPVIASNIPIFREILGDSYASFDPNDPFSIATSIEHFLAEPHEPSLTRKKLLETFSFEHMAQQTYEIYQNCIRL